MQSRRAQRVVQAEQARKRRRMTFIGGGVLAAVLIVAILIGITQFGGSSGTDAAIVVPPDVAAGASASPSASPAASPSADGGEMILAMGDPNAPVRVEEWADYQCPVCGRWATDVGPKFIQEYVDTGKVYYVFNDFPFIDSYFRNNGGKMESVQAAEGARCAFDQGKFWEYHDTLYANQHGENEGDFSKSRLKEIASKLGLDSAQFNDCLDSGKYRDQVKASYDKAVSSGVSSTPTFVIDGEQVVGYQTFEQLQQRIEAKLNS
jgi:protein-disulfide isomerase